MGIEDKFSNIIELEQFCSALSLRYIGNALGQYKKMRQPYPEPEPGTPRPLGACVTQPSVSKSKGPGFKMVTGKIKLDKGETIFLSVNKSLVRLTCDSKGNIVIGGDGWYENFDYEKLREEGLL